MELPISKFDGYQLGTFDETDHQQSDTYSTNRIPRWYGTITERKNNRTEFIASRDVGFSTLRNTIYSRLNSLITFDEFAKRPGTLTETEYRARLTDHERINTNLESMGQQNIEISGHAQLLSALNEISIVSTIERYAVSAPPEIKLHAGVELAVWLTRQPGNANRSNSLVRSGAASLLEPYRYRGV